MSKMMIQAFISIKSIMQLFLLGDTDVVAAGTDLVWAPEVTAQTQGWWMCLTSWTGGEQRLG